MIVYRVKNKSNGLFLHSKYHYYGKWVAEDRGRIYTRKSHVTQSIGKIDETSELEIVKYELVRMPS
jgi:hypothetical protein